jgi:NAD(P)-dependent dehydrogenase (short-subunit alcohol dehydrogenase family)
MMARALALNGAHKVYIIGRREAALESAAKSVTTNNIIPIVGDVTSKKSLKSIADRVEKEVGYINVLIANSGIGGPQAKITPETTLEDFQRQMWEMDFDDYVNTFSVNTAAVWYTVMAFLMLLDKGNEKGNVEQRSQVIATSSIGGFNRLAPGGYAYGQSKAGTTLMMKQLATALAPYRIRSNAICPGREFDLTYHSYCEMLTARQYIHQTWQHPLLQRRIISFLPALFLWSAWGRKRRWRVLYSTWRVWREGTVMGICW